MIRQTITHKMLNLYRNKKWKLQTIFPDLIYVEQGKKHLKYAQKKCIDWQWKGKDLMIS